MKFFETGKIRALRDRLDELDAKAGDAAESLIHEARAIAPIVKRLARAVGGNAVSLAIFLALALLDELPPIDVDPDENNKED